MRETVEEDGGRIVVCWMRVTRDKYELPIAIADTAKQLAEICGVTTNSIYSAYCRVNRNGGFTAYKRIELEDEDDD